VVVRTSVVSLRCPSSGGTCVEMIEVDEGAGPRRQREVQDDSAPVTGVAGAGSWMIVDGEREIVDGEREMDEKRAPAAELLVGEASSGGVARSAELRWQQRRRRGHWRCLSRDSTREGDGDHVL
jgi:hypothetical protein